MTAVSRSCVPELCSPQSCCLIVVTARHSYFITRYCIFLLVQSTSKLYPCVSIRTIHPIISFIIIAERVYFITFAPGQSVTAPAEYILWNPTLEYVRLLCDHFSSLFFFLKAVLYSLQKYEPFCQVAFPIGSACCCFLSCVIYDPQDFGPLNLGHFTQFCRKLDAYLRVRHSHCPFISISSFCD